MLQANTMEESITYKKYKATRTPYPIISIDGYKDLLATEKNNIYNGSTGVYLAREINWDSQKLYFFFIDVDGDPNEKNKIQSAIVSAVLTYRV